MVFFFSCCTVYAAGILRDWNSLTIMRRKKKLYFSTYNHNAVSVSQHSVNHSEQLRSRHKSDQSLTTSFLHIPLMKPRKRCVLGNLNTHWLGTILSVLPAHKSLKNKSPCSRLAGEWQLVPEHLDLEIDCWNASEVLAWHPAADARQNYDPNLIQTAAGTGDIAGH